MLGTVVGGHKLVAKIGEGGMGVVYEAEDTMLGRRTAVKMLRTALSRNHKVVQRFFNEARAAAKLRHPGIVEIHSFGYHDDGSAYLVMEHLEGESLEERLHRRGKLGTAEAIRITRQVCSALAAAHDAEIIHRDLKPDNIFLVADPDIEGGERIKLLDFGIAKLGGGGPGAMMTQAGQVMGTPSYMAPEQCRGAGGVDARADLYAVGCVLFRMVCSQVPFPGEISGDVIAAQIRDTPPRPRALDPSIDPSIEAVILRLLEKDPDRRYATAREVRRALEKRPAPYRHPTPAPLSISETLPGTGGGARRSRQVAAATAAETSRTEPPLRPSASQPIPAQPAPTQPKIAPTAGARPDATPRPAPVSPPTTLGASAGERREQSRRRGGKAIWWIAAAAILLLAGGGIGLALWLDRAGDPGEPIEAFEGGRDLERGASGAVDLGRALTYYQHACTDGDARGCAAWGRMLATGAGVDIDHQVGVELLRVACEGGAGAGCTELASLAFTVWRPRLLIDRQVWLERGCQLGEPDGCSRLASALRFAPLEDRDTARADELMARAVSLLEARCETDPHACVSLANAVRKDDPTRSLSLYENACDRGRGMACFAAADQLGQGQGADVDAARAAQRRDEGFARLTDACDSGHYQDCLDLAGRLHANPDSADKARAKDLLRRICDEGPVSVCQNGWSIDGELSQQRACERGSRGACKAWHWTLARQKKPADAAMRRVAELSRSSCAAGDAFACRAAVEFLGREPNQDLGAAEDAAARAVALADAPCRGGDDRSCLLVARLFSFNSELADYRKAAAFAERGCAVDRPNGREACVILGDLYESGKGVDRDPARARGLFNKACDRRVGRGCHRLAAMYHSGVGIPRDLAQAAEQYKRGCELNWIGSCVELAKLHEAGAGVSRDLARAQALFSKACKQGRTRCADACRLGDNSSCK